MPQTLSIYRLDYHRNSFDAFRAIRHLPFPVMLESGRGQYKEHMGRFDILTADPIEVLQVTPECQGEALLNQLNERIKTLSVDIENMAERHAHLPFLGGAIGFLTYDFGRQLEVLPATATQDISLPTAWFGLFGWALVTDHLREESWLVYDSALTDQSSSDIMDLFEMNEAVYSNQPATPFVLTTPFKSNLSHQNYLDKFEHLQHYIHSGDCYQVNFAQRFSADCEGDAFSAFETISKKIPTPFSGFFQLGQWDILSHSPERFLELDAGQVTTKPIKGTRRRGGNGHDDQELREELSQSTKDKAENLMIVDLLRNDLSRVCKPFSVKVPKLFDIETYPNVHHLVSTVTGDLEESETATSLLAHSFPGGSITGAPKIRAMEIIDELEPHHRSLYCGSIVYISRHGRMDSSITIRTLIRDGEKIHAWGGGGIVADSDAESEYQETLTKITPLLRAIDS